MIDPTVQVAVVSVFATLVTTSGVVVVAVLNKKMEKDDDGLEDLDAAQLVKQLLAMIAENQRKETFIQELKIEISDYKRRVSFLEGLIPKQKEGNSDD